MAAQLRLAGTGAAGPPVARAPSEATDDALATPRAFASMAMPDYGAGRGHSWQPAADPAAGEEGRGARRHRRRSRQEEGEEGRGSRRHRHRSRREGGEEASEERRHRHRRRSRRAEEDRGHSSRRQVPPQTRPGSAAERRALEEQLKAEALEESLGRPPTPPPRPVGLARQLSNEEVGALGRRLLECDSDVSLGALRAALEDATTCTICYESSKNAALVPCGHRFCIACAQRFSGTCPACRAAITSVLQTFG